MGLRDRGNLGGGKDLVEDILKFLVKMKIIKDNGH